MMTLVSSSHIGEGVGVDEAEGVEKEDLWRSK